MISGFVPGIAPFSAHSPAVARWCSPLRPVSLCKFAFAIFMNYPQIYAPSPLPFPRLVSFSKSPVPFLQMANFFPFCPFGSRRGQSRTGVLLPRSPTKACPPRCPARWGFGLSRLLCLYGIRGYFTPRNRFLDRPEGHVVITFSQPQ